MCATNIIDVSDQQRKWRREMIHTLTNKSLELETLLMVLMYVILAKLLL